MAPTAVKNAYRFAAYKPRRRRVALMLLSISIENGAGLIATVALLAYLVYALVRAERF